LCLSSVSPIFAWKINSSIYFSLNKKIVLY
jgi:hypothetical protein